jgi:hypothetical protein
MIPELTLVVLATFSNSIYSNDSDPASFSLGDEVALVQHDFASFARAMAAANKEDGFFATSIEKIIYFFDLKKEERFAYLDFDGDNGYAVLASKLEMPAFCSKGQLAISSNTNIFYDREMGFVTISESGGLDKLDGVGSNYPLKTGAYAGQEAGANGSGKIIDPITYVEARYGSGWTYTANYTPSWNAFPVQRNYSIYQKHGDDGTLTFEGNCLLASLYEVIDYYRYSGVFPLLPSSYVNCNPQADSFYWSLMNERTMTGAPRYSVVHQTLPAVYKTIRDWFRDNDAYRFDLATVSRGVDCVHYLSEHYGIALTSRQLFSWNYESDIRDSINTRYRMYVWNEADGTYSAHSMPVCGTFRFQKTSGWWIFTHTDTVNLIRVADNYVESERFIDLSAYQNEFPNSGSFIEVKWK